MERFSNVIERENPGCFIREFSSFPGFINGCSYRLDFAEGCQFNCKYCFLNDYLESPGKILLYSNYEKINGELKEKYEILKGKTVSLGVLNDSFFPLQIRERIFKLSQIFKRYPEITFELRTKADLKDDLNRIAELPDNCSIVFSMNTPEINKKMEKGTAGIFERINSAENLVKLSQRKIGIVFDPIIYYPEFLNDFIKVIDSIKNHIPEEKIYFIGLGFLRLMPETYKKILDDEEASDLVFSSRFIRGNKDKAVYPMAFRLKIYYRVIDKILNLFKKVNIRFYMEYEYVPEILNLKKVSQEDFTYAGN
ncbi:MAG: hypothetical protein PHV06_05620 [bacterium]|nr:hypothetical protein [bacterium]